MKKLFSAVQEQEAKVEMRKNVASTEGWGGAFAGHLTGATLTGLAYTGLPVVGAVAGGAANAGAAALVNNYNKKITKEARALNRLIAEAKAKGIESGKLTQKQVDKIQDTLENKSVLLHGIGGIIPFFNIGLTMVNGHDVEESYKKLQFMIKESEKLTRKLERDGVELEVKKDETLENWEYALPTSFGSAAMESYGDEINSFFTPAVTSIEEFDDEGDTPLIVDGGEKTEEAETPEFSSDDITDDKEQAEEMKETVDAAAEEEEASEEESTEGDFGGEESSEETSSEEVTGEGEVADTGEENEPSESKGIDSEAETTTTEEITDSGATDETDKAELSEEESVAQEAYDAYHDLIAMSSKRELSVKDTQKADYAVTRITNFLSSKDIITRRQALEGFETEATSGFEVRMAVASIESALNDVHDNVSLEGFFDIFRKLPKADAINVDRLDTSKGWPTGQMFTVNLKAFKSMPAEIKSNPNITALIKKFLIDSIDFFDTAVEKFNKREVQLEKYRNDLIIMIATGTALTFSTKVKDIPKPNTNLRRDYTGATFGILNKEVDMQVPSMEEIKEIKKLIEVYRTKSNDFERWTNSRGVDAFVPFSTSVLIAYHQNKMINDSRERQTNSVLSDLNDVYSTYTMDEIDDAFNTMVDESYTATCKIAYMINCVDFIYDRLITLCK